MSLIKSRGDQYNLLKNFLVKFSKVIVKYFIVLFTINFYLKTILTQSRIILVSKIFLVFILSVLDIFFFLNFEIGQKLFFWVVKIKLVDDYSFSIPIRCHNICSSLTIDVTCNYCKSTQLLHRWLRRSTADAVHRSCGFERKKCMNCVLRVLD